LGKLKKTASQTCHRKSLDENFKTKTSQKLQYTERERERERESSSSSSSKKIGISAYFLMLESESS
jgi:hypothetical protein